MRIAIVGSRDYAHLDKVRAYVGNLPSTVTIVTGGARGVDKTAEEAAKARGMECIVFPALWGQYGRRAGALRNQQIVDAADQVIAFWDGVSPGTKISIDMARRANKPVRIIE